MSLNKPFLLYPVGKNYLWGGERLKFKYGKNLPFSPLAETWECSTHPDGISVVSSGEYQGKTLSDVLKLHPDFLGSHPKTKPELPILIKFLDAQKELSIQVHPDDEYADRFENGQRGKAEVWYVLEADEDAKIVYGVHHQTDKDTILKSIEEGTVDKYLLKIPIKKGDVFFISPGTIHALCRGAVVAEIQENSNLTYRLYDYGRIDANGNRRELHIDKALSVAKLVPSIEPRQPMHIIKYKPFCADELITRCEYFEIHRILLNGVMNFSSDSESFRVLLCIDGRSVFQFGAKDEKLFVEKGQCVFIPANSCEIKISGEASFLDTRC